MSFGSSENNGTTGNTVSAFDSSLEAVRGKQISESDKRDGPEIPYLLGKFLDAPLTLTEYCQDDVNGETRRKDLLSQIRENEQVFGKTDLGALYRIAEGFLVGTTPKFLKDIPPEKLEKYERFYNAQVKALKTLLRGGEGEALMGPVNYRFAELMALQYMPDGTALDAEDVLRKIGRGELETMPTNSNPEISNDIMRMHKIQMELPMHLSWSEGRLRMVENNSQFSDRNMARLRELEGRAKSDDTVYSRVFLFQVDELRDGLDALTGPTALFNDRTEYRLGLEQRLSVFEKVIAKDWQSTSAELHRLSNKYQEALDAAHFKAENYSIESEKEKYVLSVLTEARLARQSLEQVNELKEEFRQKG